MHACDYTMYCATCVFVTGTRLGGEHQEDELLVADRGMSLRRELPGKGPILHENGRQRHEP